MSRPLDVAMHKEDVSKQVNYGVDFGERNYDLVTHAGEHNNNMMVKTLHGAATEFQYMMQKLGIGRSGRCIHLLGVSS